MDNLNLISNFAEFKELKNIDKSTMIGVLEDVFRHALQKQYETDENFDVIINPEKGDLEIWRNRTVVADDEVENPNMQISVSEAKQIDPTYEVPHSPYKIHRPPAFRSTYSQRPVFISFNLLPPFYFHNHHW